MRFLKSHWSNILFLLIIILLIIPQTRKPIQVQINRIFSFSPSKVSEGERKITNDYNWKLKEVEGGVTNLQAAQGEVVIINLWATWCPPCIAEMPSFEALYEDYGNKVKFYFISSEEREKLQKFMEKYTYSFSVYQPLSVPPVLFRSNSLPTTYVLSRSGEVVVEKTGAADWNSTSFRSLLDDLLKEGT